MQQADLFLLFTQPLDAAQIAYMVSGDMLDQSFLGEQIAHMNLSREWKLVTSRRIEPPALPSP